MALRRGDRKGHDGLDGVDGEAGQPDEAVLDVEHDLAGDQQVVVERQGVLGEVDDPFDGVLDRYHAAVDVGGLDGVEDVGNGGEVDELGGDEIVLRAHGLLGERAEGPEEADPSDRTRHHCGEANECPASHGETDVDDPSGDP